MVTQNVSLLVFFKPDRLPIPQRYDLGARRQVMQEGIKVLRRRFPDLVLGPEIASACAVGVRASVDLVDDLTRYVQENGLGTFEIDGPMIRAAKEL